jgi:hypothetical protein
MIIRYYFGRTTLDRLERNRSFEEYWFTVSAGESVGEAVTEV